jgi:hypothetical protein
MPFPFATGNVSRFATIETDGNRIGPRRDGRTSLS